MEQRQFKPSKAVALCRVSTSKQRIEGSSLEAQEKYIYECADTLNTEIIRIWSLDTSSRKGKNIYRKDLQEMLAFCKSHKSVKFLILDEIDRFMRSISEYYWWKTNFEIIGVKLAFAKSPELTGQETQASVFNEMIGIYQAESSNHERITKTKDKMQAKIAAGYYPGNPRCGYRKSDTPGLHVPDEPNWHIMRTTFKELASGAYDINYALKQLHERGYTTRKFGPRTTGGKKIDMFRFKAMLLDPYYAGIVTMSDWPTINEYGLHEAMITKADHLRLKEIVNNKGKKFIVQRDNPLFPLSNQMECKQCLEENKDHPRLVGYKHSNGKKRNSHKEYLRYRCRSCNQNIRQDELHALVAEKLSSLLMPEDKIEKLKMALRRVWRKTEEASLQRARTAEGRLAELKVKKNELVLAIAGNSDLTDDYKEALTLIKTQIDKATIDLQDARNIEEDFLQFTEFAITTMNNWHKNWWDLEKQDQVRCKQILFPDGFQLQDKEKIYTPEISLAYRYEETKIAPEEATFTNMEVDLSLNLHPLVIEMRRWREIIGPRYEYRSMAKTRS